MEWSVVSFIEQLLGRLSLVRHWRGRRFCLPGESGPNFMALLTAEFCAYDHHSPAQLYAQPKRRIVVLAL